MTHSHLPTINLICTVHSEHGNCTPDELHNIIERINPEVIFEEMSESLFDRYYLKSEPIEESLEVKCIKKYRQTHSIKHFPVDIEPSPNLSEGEIEYMFKTIGKYDAYKRLEHRQNLLTAKEGFLFLNSQECLEIFEEKKSTANEIMMFDVNRQQLSRIHKLFHDEHDNRERNMLRRIYDLSKEHPYNQAVFLIGAGHRKSIMQKVADIQNKGEMNLNWAFGLPFLQQK